MKVCKRNGQKEIFDARKILQSVESAYKSTKKELDYETKKALINHFKAETLFNWCTNELKKKEPSVEDIQDRVEKFLVNHDFDAAKAYILYREQRKQARFIRGRINYMEQYSQSHDNAATSSETDANANITMKNVANLEGEVYKVTNRLIQRTRMKEKLNELYPEVAKQYEQDLNHHIIYTHDEASTPTLKQYCMAVSLYPLMAEGVGNIDGVTPSAPNDLQSFSGQITNLTFLLSSQCKGAVAFSEYFIALNYYIIKEFGALWYEKLDAVITTDYCIEKRTIRNQIYKAFKQFVWGINQPAGNRSYQSPFTNISYFDHTYFTALFKDFYYPDGSKPQWAAIDCLQRLFMKWFNKIRLKQILAFPVNCSAA
jgi:ribonucleoside-triphosphate reductase (formate)